MSMTAHLLGRKVQRAFRKAQCMVTAAPSLATVQPGSNGASRQGISRSEPALSSFELSHESRPSALLRITQLIQPAVSRSEGTLSSFLVSHDSPPLALCRDLEVYLGRLGGRLPLFSGFPRLSASCPMQFTSLCLGEKSEEGIR